MKNSKKFWNWLDVKNEADTPEERVLEINGEIASESWFDDDVTPKLFKDELLSGSLLALMEGLACTLKKRTAPGVLLPMPTIRGPSPLNVLLIHSIHMP